MKRQSAVNSSEAHGSLRPAHRGASRDRVLFVCNDAAYFAAHRASVASDLIAQGLEVHLCAGGEGTRPRDLHQDIVFHPVRLERHALSLRSDLRFMRIVRQLTRSLRPTAVHLITIKPNLFGGLALAVRGGGARAGAPRIIMTFPGLGKIFEKNETVVGRLREWLTAKTLRLVAAAIDAQATFENEENRNHLIALGAFPAGSTHVTFGTGIDLLRFESPAESRHGPLTFVFASRLLNAKGVASFIAAAASRRAEGSPSRFIVAGGQDGSNPDNFDLAQLRDFHASGKLEFKGQLDLPGIARLLQEADVVCLPTELNEGLPRILLEGASCGCAAIASDQPTIARLVINGVTGQLIDPKSPFSLVEAIRSMEMDPARTREMGKNMGELIRTLPVTEDSVNAVFLKLYGLTPSQGR